MTYSVNWSTKVVTIPKADTVLVSASPDVRSLDLTTLWENIIAIEESSEAISFDTIVRNVAPFTVAGVTLARVVEIINGYKIEFEDGQYAVNILGGNSNISDVIVRNQVSVNTGNSAGLVQVSSGSGLSTEQATMLEEIYVLMGLDPGRPLTTHQTYRRVPADGSTIDQAIDQDNGVVTVTRQ
jgi:hypothetical protein